MAPPELARDAPVLDVVEPVEIGVLPVVRHEADAAAFDGLDRRLRDARPAAGAAVVELLAREVDEPLVGQEGFDDGAAAIAPRHLELVIDDLLDQAARVDRLAFVRARDRRCRWHVGDRFEVGDDLLARDEAIESAIALRNRAPVERRGGAGGGTDAVRGLGILVGAARPFLIGHRADDVRGPREDVEHGQAVTLAERVVVEVVRGRDLHAAGAEFAVDVVIGDDRNLAVAERQDHRLADQMPVALVLRVHGHGRVAEHGFRARGRDDDVVERAAFGIGPGCAVRERIAEVPELAVLLLAEDFEIGDRGLQHRVPIHEALAAIDQTVLVQLHEVLDDGLRVRGVHREGFARPVDARAHAADLLADGAGRELLPLPDLVEKLLAAELGARRLAGQLQIALDDHLRGDARMVGAWLPERVVAEHAVVARQRVHDRVLEGMAHVQRAGHVRRRDHDRVRLAAAAGLEAAAGFPGLAPVRFDALRIESLVHEHSVGTRPDTARRRAGAGSKKGREL